MDLKKLIFGQIDTVKVTKPPKSNLMDDPMENEEEKKTGLMAQSKKIKKSKKPHDKDIKVKYIGYPRKLIPNDRCRKRYSCEVHYVDGSGKLRTKHVRFGNEGKKEFIDHHDNKIRMNTVSKLQHTEDPLHGNFYKAFILNSKETDFNKAYIQLLDGMGIKTD